MGQKTYNAVVQATIKAGEHGPYAVTKCDGLEGSVTFSLVPPAWPEKEWPEPGSVVVLSQVHRKRAGWRANHSRFFKPADQQTAKSKQKGARK